tara:strand:- start:458 stop:658 length:201 start_codon:yes stop_codon:yes gene_type:complete
MVISYSIILIVTSPLMKKLPRPTILNGKGKPFIHHPYTGAYRTNRYFDMIAEDFRLLHKPFTPVIK